MDGWVGGYLVVPTLHLHLHFIYIAYTFFSFDDGIFCSTCSSTCSSTSLAFSFGYHLQEKSSCNLAKKIPGKATKFPEVWSWESYITYLVSSILYSWS